MQTVFRVDASRSIGIGHVMRCLTLADKLAETGSDITFLCRNHNGHAGDVILAHKYGLHLLSKGGFADSPPPHAAWLGATLEEEIAACRKWLDRGTDLLVVDHYALDWRWESAMRPVAPRIMVIDDLADRAHTCDMLLDQNLAPNYRTRYTGLVPAGCRLLLGPAWALLRPEFYALAVQTAVRRRVERLLIFFGGADPDNLTGMVLDELKETPLKADVVIGSANPHRQILEQLCQTSQGRWVLHVQTRRMASLMAQADLAIGAGGTSHWERCLMGLPAIVATVADNQVETTRLLHERGACCWLGAAEALPAKAWRIAVEAFVENPEKLSAMSRTARTVVPSDGGPGQVVDVLKDALISDSQ